MAIFGNTVSICHFTVVGEFPKEDLAAWVGERLRLNAFSPIDDSLEESGTGWVHVDDSRLFHFETEQAWRRDQYLAFTLRRDQRKVPAALLKAYQQIDEYEWLQEKPGLKRVPKKVREEIKERVKLKLLSKTLPVPTTLDAVWDTRTNTITWTSLSPRNVELFEDFFKKTFEGLRLVAFHPYARGEKVVPEELQEVYAKANRSPNNDVLSLIRENRWLGCDLLLWLLYRTMNESGEYRVCTAGREVAGTPFVAFLNDRFVLMSGSENGIQKITVSGSQDSFSEVKAALRAGKEISEATIRFEKDENEWKLTLKGELFHLGSFKCPSVKIERDAAVDEASEREAVFYERMYLLETGLQLLESLFCEFLKERLSPQWEERQKEIAAWLEQ